MPQDAAGNWIASGQPSATPNIPVSSTGAAASFYPYAGPPSAPPPTYGYVVVDSNGVQWMYWQNAWH
jgi:hypothetical protein